MRKREGEVSRASRAQHISPSLELTSSPPSFELRYFPTATTVPRAHPTSTPATESSSSSVGVGSQSKRNEGEKSEIELSLEVVVEGALLAAAADLEEDDTEGVGRTGGALFLIVDVAEEVVVVEEGGREGRGS